MFYVKNVPGWERALRILAGAAMLMGGLMGLKGMAMGYALAGSGLAAIGTGFFGFCPMCAMAGRKIAADNSKV